MTALFMIGVIVTLLALDVGARALTNRARPAPAPLPAFAVDLRATKARFYSSGHTWASLREDGEVRVGVDDFARAAVGAADRFEVPPTGTRIEKGQALVTAVKDGRRLVFPSPLSGIVTDAAPAREGGGDRTWLVALDPVRLGSEIKSLFVGEEAAAWIKNEVARFREFLFGGPDAALATATLPDGGTPVEGVLCLLPDETWKAFEAEFLTRR